MDNAESGALIINLKAPSPLVMGKNAVALITEFEILQLSNFRIVVSHVTEKSEQISKSHEYSRAPLFSFTCETTTRKFEICDILSAIMSAIAFLPIITLHRCSHHLPVLNAKLSRT